MKRFMNGFIKVFSFTFSNHIRAKGYRAITVTLALLCFLVPLGAMTYAGNASQNDADVSGTAACGAKTVYVADETPEPIDYSFLNAYSAQYDKIGALQYVSVGNDREQAAALANKDDTSLLLWVSGDADAGYSAKVWLPENSSLTSDESEAYQHFLDECFSAVLQVKSGIAPEILAQVSDSYRLTDSIEGEGITDQTADPAQTVRQILSMALPYISILFLYFMILFYGQGVANSVIMEKNSKLMDTFLLSVEPSSMIFGKQLAICTAGICQLMCWVICLVGGFTAGTAIVRSFFPDASLSIIAFFESIGSASGVFAPYEIIISILIVLAGFIMYCALSALGGAMAEKPEDLSTTNMLFTLALVISFLCTLYAGGMNGMSSDAAWLVWVPFTAVLVTPARLLLGSVSPLEGLGSLGLIVLITVLIAFLAGKVYKMMSFYHGNPPKPWKVLELLYSNKKSKK